MAQRIYFSVGVMLIILATIWVDQWLVLISVGFVICSLGALAGTRPLFVKDIKRRRYKYLGIMLIAAGCTMCLMALVEKFLRPYFIR